MKLAQKAEITGENIRSSDTITVNGEFYRIICGTTGDIDTIMGIMEKVNKKNEDNKSFTPLEIIDINS